ncbi:MAG TPA: PTS sugar transporter subunit IIA [Terrimicrobiaceae bacterium]|nr:PTS sugar transporter subunit IIA [Terrimicrobiaceae bacterium]
MVEYCPDAATIIHAVQAREETMPTYLGKGLAVPHGRLDGIDKPILAFARCAEGVPQEATSERAELLFLLLTPTGLARIQPRLLADIAGLIESEYVTERLRKATTAGGSDRSDPRRPAGGTRLSVVSRRA